MNVKKLFTFLGIGIIVGFIVGIILRNLVFPGPSPPSSYDGFMGLGEFSEKLAKLLLIIPTVVGGLVGLITYGINKAREAKNQ